MPASNSARRTKRSRPGPARPRGRAHRLTELDYSVLGVVWRDGPITTYGVRERFAASVTATWSSSTGSIYPAIRRLVAGGLIRAGAHRDGRGTQELSITSRGITTLRHWLRSASADLGGVAADPVRTRIQFLAALTPRDTARFLAAAEEECRSALRIFDSSMANEPGGRGAQRLWALRGVRDQLEARIRWIGWVRRSAVKVRSRRP